MLSNNVTNNFLSKNFLEIHQEGMFCHHFGLVCLVVFCVCNSHKGFTNSRSHCTVTYKRSDNDSCNCQSLPGTYVENSQNFGCCDHFAKQLFKPDHFEMFNCHTVRYGV